uniref:Uncharacterized protein MANES_S056600 n=1 Tax=Rhizophora mucronata TaxID=61149 RepID=A0A2P2JHC4_RHIMU
MYPQNYVENIVDEGDPQKKVAALDRVGYKPYLDNANHWHVDYAPQLKHQQLEHHRLDQKKHQMAQVWHCEKDIQSYKVAEKQNQENIRLCCNVESICQMAESWGKMQSLLSYRLLLMHTKED